MDGGTKPNPPKDIKVRISALFGEFLCKPGLSSPAMLSMTTISSNVSIISVILFHLKAWSCCLCYDTWFCLIIFNLKVQSWLLQLQGRLRKAQLWRKISGQLLSWACCSDFWKAHHRDICTSVFTAILFKIAKEWNQPRFPTREWIKKMQQRYIIALFSAIKNKVMPFAENWRWTYKLSWFQEGKNCMYFSHMWFLGFI